MNREALWVVVESFTTMTSLYRKNQNILLRVKKGLDQGHCDMRIYIGGAELLICSLTVDCDTFSKEKRNTSI